MRYILVYDQTKSKLTLWNHLFHSADLITRWNAHIFNCQSNNCSFIIPGTLIIKLNWVITESSLWLWRQPWAHTIMTTHIYITSIQYSNFSCPDIWTAAALITDYSVISSIYFFLCYEGYDLNSRFKLQNWFEIIKL